MPTLSVAIRFSPTDSLSGRQNCASDYSVAPFGASIIFPHCTPGLRPEGYTLPPPRGSLNVTSWLSEALTVMIRRSSKTNVMVSSAQHQFAICIQNEGYLASLELWKVYRMLPDRRAARDQLVRIIDESGEDYFYDQGWFIPIKLPPAAKKAILAAAA
jgi:hypothetical protein